MKRLIVFTGLILFSACGGEPAGPATVASVTVTPGTDTLTALGQTRQYTAVARDAGGNVLSGRTVTWSSLAAGVASVDPGTGLATAVTNGSATIRATIDGMNGDAVLTVVQAVATVTVTPGTWGLTSIGATRQFTAVARDANANPVAGVRFLWLSSDQSVATIDTTGLATAKKGGLTTITAAAQGIPGYATLSVLQTADRLGFRVAPPVSTVAGEIFANAVQVEVRDAGGVLIPDAEVPITLTASTGTLRGTTTVNAINGVASFSGLWMELAGAGYTLRASSSGLNFGTSAPFAIVHGPLARVGITATPATGFAGAVLAPVPEVTLYDRFDNVATGLTGAVTLAVGQSTYGTGLVGTTDRAPVNGVATFPGVTVTKAGLVTRLVASAGGTASPPSLPFNMFTDFTEFGLGPRHSCGLTANGAFCWGGGDGGKLGTGDTQSDSVPNLVQDGRVFTQVTGGWFHTCALSATGHVYCWGNGTEPPDSLATSLAFTSIAAGYFHTCGLTSAGAAHCWGSNVYGQLGAGVDTSAELPLPVAGGLTFTQIDAGSDHACGITTDSLAYCWGANGFGQLGDSSTDTSNVPVPVYGGIKFSAIATGFAHSCAIGPNQWAFCWGDNVGGALGSTANTMEVIPTLASSFLSFTGLTAGDFSSCGLSTAADIWCWGFIGGSGATMVPVGVGVPYTRIEVGGSHACARRSDAHIACWGGNGLGALGDGTTTNRASPVFVKGQQ